MDFYIRKDATLPILKLKLIKDGRNSFRNFWEMLEDSSITFSMIDVDTGVFKIANEQAYVTLRTVADENTDKEYYLCFQFESEHTNEPGIYQGEFLIVFYDYENNHAELGQLRVPIRNNLYIHILDSFTKSTEKNFS